MRPADPSADGYVLALEEARRALDEQERAVAELRARAGTLVSAATIATSFLGAPFVADRRLGVASAVAICAFVLLSVATLTLLWSRWGVRVHAASCAHRRSVRPADRGRARRLPAGSVATSSSISTPARSAIAVGSRR